jgi:hypothetical protein
MLGTLIFYQFHFGTKINFCYLLVFGLGDEREKVLLSDPTCQILFVLSLFALMNLFLVSTHAPKTRMTS